MSQEKIDARKKNKGELLHAAKKQGRITAIVIACVLFILGATSSVVCYKKGNNKGYNDGFNNGYVYGALAAAQSTTAASKPASTTASTDKTEAGTTEAATTAAAEESTTAADETPIEVQPQ